MKQKLLTFMAVSVFALPMYGGPTLDELCGIYTNTAQQCLEATVYNFDIATTVSAGSDANTVVFHNLCGLGEDIVATYNDATGVFSIAPDAYFDYDYYGNGNPYKMALIETTADNGTVDATVATDGSIIFESYTITYAQFDNYDLYTNCTNRLAKCATLWEVSAYWTAEGLGSGSGKTTIYAYDSSVTGYDYSFAVSGSYGEVEMKVKVNANGDLYVVNAYSNDPEDATYYDPEDDGYFYYVNSNQDLWQLYTTGMSGAVANGSQNGKLAFAYEFYNHYDDEDPSLADKQFTLVWGEAVPNPVGTATTIDALCGTYLCEYSYKYEGESFKEYIQVDIAKSATDGCVDIQNLFGQYEIVTAKVDAENGRIIFPAKSELFKGYQIRESGNEYNDVVAVVGEDGSLTIETYDLYDVAAGKIWVSDNNSVSVKIVPLWETEAKWHAEGIGEGSGSVTLKVYDQSKAGFTYAFMVGNVNFLFKVTDNNELVPLNSAYQDNDFDGTYYYVNTNGDAIDIYSRGTDKTTSAKYSTIEGTDNTTGKLTFHYDYFSDYNVETPSIEKANFTLAWGTEASIAKPSENALPQSNAPAYDLQGRRLNKVPAKGLYLQGGKLKVAK